MSLFKRKKNDNAPEAVYEEEKGDYSVKNNKILNRVMMVVSLLAAFALWFYVYASTQTTDELTFNLINIGERYADTLRSDYDLVVQSLNIDTVNVTIMGSRSEINSISSTDVKAYINLRDITEAGEYALDVIVDVPEGVTVVSQTVSQVIVSVDRSTEKTYEVDGDSVILYGWALEEGYSFGKTTTNVTSVLLKGAEKNIGQISGVGLRTSALGSVSGSMSSMCDVVLLDSQGNIIDQPGVQIIPDRENVTAYIEVLKEKTVPLSVASVYGRIDSSNVRISPSEVTIKGDASFIDAIDTIVIGTIDEKNEDQLVYQKTFTLSSGLYSITGVNGQNINSATASVDLTKLPSRKMTGVPLYNGDEQIGTVSVNLVAVSDTSMCAVMINNMTVNNVRAYSDKDVTDDSTIVIDIDQSYSVYLYEYGKVTIEKLFDSETQGEDGESGEPDESASFASHHDKASS